MSSESKGRVFRRFFTVFSVFIIASLFGTKLTDYSLADNIPLGSHVLGVDTENDAIQVIPQAPKTISIFKPKTVEIRYRDTLYRGISYSNTVEGAVRDLGITTTDNTQFKPDKDYILGIFTSIELTEVEKVKHVAYEYVPFETVEREDSTTEWGVSSIVKPGVTGQKKLVYEYLYINDKLMGKKLISEEITLEPVNEIVSIGTMRVYKTIEINGDTVTYWRKMTVWATSYDSTCKGCSTTTATGRTLTKGIIAVDPKVIPLHTKMYVPGYGFGAAEDVGGAVKENKIDLGFASLKDHIGEWSARYVEIYILD